MEAVYRLKPHELTGDFFKNIKDLFGDQEIKITVEADETACLLRDEANRRHLLAGVEAARQGRISRSMTLEEAEAMAE